jgi:nitronate monooxygenase
LGLDVPSPPPCIDLPPFGDTMCLVVETARPEVVSFHFGLPEPPLLARIKAASEAHGDDVVIAQGNEAGGHRGMFLATDLIKNICRATGNARASAAGR